MSQWLELHVAAEQITIRLVADAPLEAWEALIGGPVEDDARVIDALSRGFQLSVDGRTHPLTPVSGQRRWDLTTGTATTWEVTLTADVDLGGGRHRVNVGNRNLQEGPSWLRDDVTLAPGVVLYDTNLFRTDALDRRVDRTATWLVAETLRGVSLDLEFPDDPLTAMFARAMPRPRTPAEAEARPFADAWRRGVDTAGTFGAAGALALALGATSAAVVRHAGVWIVATALALAATLLPALPVPWAAAAAVVGASAAASGRASLARVAWLLPVASGVWASRSVGASLGTWAFLVVGVLASPLLARLDRPRAIAAVAVVLALVAGTRGIG